MPGDCAVVRQVESHRNDLLVQPVNALASFFVQNNQDVLGIQGSSRAARNRDLASRTRHLQVPIRERRVRQPESELEPRLDVVLVKVAVVDVQALGVSDGRDLGVGIVENLGRVIPDSLSNRVRQTTTSHHMSDEALTIEESPYLGL